ncbi:homeobox-leucine zipper protein ATHB-15 [Trifolium repens]|nr:homeobox-leucine zipper protein ATHB-15 [Trifolium repens]
MRKDEAIKVGPCSLTGSRIGNYGGQVILPLAHTIEHDEFLEVIKLDGVAHSPEDTMMARELFLLQLCIGMDENAIGTYAELIFAPIDASFADDAPLLPSGFRIIPLESGKEASSPNATLDLASALDVGGPTGNRAESDNAGNSGCVRSVMTIAFEFAFESHMQENVACMACQYVRSIISSVQRVALALSPSHLSSHAGMRSPLGTPEAQTLAHWICNSYRCYLGVDLLKSNNEGKEPILKSLWHHSDVVLCCTLKIKKYLDYKICGKDLHSSAGPKVKQDGFFSVGEIECMMANKATEKASKLKHLKRSTQQMSSHDATPRTMPSTTRTSNGTYTNDAPHIRESAARTSNDPSPHVATATRTSNIPPPEVASTVTTSNVSHHHDVLHAACATRTSNVMPPFNSQPCVSHAVCLCFLFV